MPVLAVEVSPAGDLVPRQAIQSFNHPNRLDAMRAFFQLHPFITVLAAVVLSVLVAFSLSFLFISSFEKPEEEKGLNELQYAAIFDDDGLITEVIDGPVDYIDANAVIFYEQEEIENLFGPYPGSYPVEATVAGELLELTTKLLPDISREDAVRYYNAAVTEELMNGHLVSNTTSLEEFALKGISQEAWDMAEQGDLPVLVYEVVGLPTIAYDEEAMAAYAAQLEGEALAATRFQQKQAAVQELCKEFPELEDEFLGFCSAYHGEGVPLPPPGQHNPKDPGQGPSFQFMCARYELVPTNWEEVSAALENLFRNTGVTFTEPSGKEIDVRTEQPCGYTYPSSSDMGNLPVESDNPSSDW